jgi:PAS domain S-box-containing protein
MQEPNLPPNLPRGLSQGNRLLGKTPESSALRFQSVQPIVQRALQALHLHAARYLMLAETHSDRIARFLPDGKITYANLAFAQHCDRTPLELIGQHLWSILGRSDGSANLEVFQKQLRQLSPKHRHQTYQQRSVRAGQVAWDECRLSVLLNSRSQMVEVQMVVRDITAQKMAPGPDSSQNSSQNSSQTDRRIDELQAQVAQLQAELAQRSSAPAISNNPTTNHQDSILETLQEGVVVVRADGIILQANGVARGWLGRSDGFFHHPWQVGIELTADEQNHPVNITLKTGVPCQEMLLGLDRDDGRWFSVNTKPLFETGGLLPDAVIVTLYDVTQRRLTEQERARFFVREQGAKADADLARARISQILESVTDGFVSFDRDWSFTCVNREAARIIGRSARSLLGQILWEVFPGFSASTVAENYRRAMERRQVVETVEYYAPCDRWYSIRAYPSSEGISVYFRNMTDLYQGVQERDRVSESLRESEERFRQLAENIQQVFWMYDVEAKQLSYISPACEGVLGYPPDQACAMTWQDWSIHVHPVDIARTMRAAKLPLLGQSSEVTYRYRNPQGEQRWILARGFPVRNAQGQVYRVAGIAEDITDRRQKEDWLLLLESVILKADDAVVITEAEPVELPGPHIVFVNDAFARMMGYTREEVIGKTPRILQGPKTNLATLRGLKDRLKRFEPVRSEMVNYRKDGSEIWIELSLFPVGDRTGNYTYWVGIQRDITSRKQTEAEVQKALTQERELSELKSRFVTTTSHEFRTPLSTILSSADLLEFYADEGTLDKCREHTHRIQNAALNMNNLLSDILVFEKAEANLLQCDPVAMDLRAFCLELLEEMRLNDKGQHNLDFQVQRRDGLLDQTAPIKSYMDEKLLRHIGSNLISNALKYSGPGTWVKFCLECDASQVILTVTDEGIGVPLEDQARLFEPFHRAKNVGAISGNGLGLAIAKQAAEAHKGTIAIESQLEQGTKVQVNLPRYAVETHQNHG